MDKDDESSSRILSRKSIISSHSEEIKNLLRLIANEHDVCVHSAAISLSSILSHVITLEDIKNEHKR